MTLVEYAQGMTSAHREHSAAASAVTGTGADPRAYMRIAAMLRERITAGDLAPGQTTPSITRLCADHGVARQTAAHALRVLQDAGLVYRVPGLGYHVRNDILSRLPRTANVLQLLISRARTKESRALLNGRTGRYPVWPGRQGASPRTRSCK
jgi:DNA-binding GntR family transcriptional regulator